MGEVEIRVSDHKALFKALTEDGLPTRMLELTAEQRAALEKVGNIYEIQRLIVQVSREELKQAEIARVLADKEQKAAQARLETARKAHADKPSDESKTTLEEATKAAANVKNVLKEADDGVQRANKVIAEAQKKLDEHLTRKQPGLDASVNEFVDRALRKLWQHPDLIVTFDREIFAALGKAAPARKNTVAAARKRLIETGLASNRDGGRLEWHPIRKGSTPFEKFAVERFNAALLAELILPGAVTTTAAPNYVDYRLFAPKSWRDVYQYDKAGKLTGWRRYDGARVTDFTEEGLMVLEKDGEGRPLKVQSVRYQQQPPKEPWRPNALEQAPGEVIVTYAYEDGKRVEKSRTGEK